MIKILAFVASVLALGSAQAQAASYSSSFSSRSSYSSSSFSRSYSAPSYSAPKVSPAPAASASASAWKPAPAYSVRSTTVTSSYTPAPKVGRTTTTTTTIRTGAPPSSVTATRPSIYRKVVIHQYGYPGGYYDSGWSAFWHGYFWASMFNHSGYGPVYANGAPAPVVVSNGGGWSALWTVFLIGMGLFVLWMIWMAWREERRL